MNVTIPVLVEETKRPDLAAPMYTVRALLRDGPRGQGEHLSRAMSKLANELRKALEALGRQARHDDLLPWTFCPAVADQTLKTRLTLRRGTAQVRVLVISFNALDRRIAMMPALPGRWFEIQRGQKVLDRAKEVLTDYLDELEKESDEFKVPVAFTAGNRQWVTTLEIDVQLEPDLKPPAKDFFARLGGPEKMSGRDELHKVGRCLDWLYPDELDRAVLRDAEVRELETLLSAKDRRPVMLVGPPRVGKTAVIHECVFRRAQKSKALHVSKRHTWLISPQRLISGMSYVGQWEGRVLAIFAEAVRRDHVLYFDDVLGLHYAGLSRDSDLAVAHVLKPYIERREFRVLAEMTPEAFRILQERDRGLADLFHMIPLRPPGEAQTRRVLVNVIRQMESRHRCRFDLEALPQVLELSNRYLRDLAQPGKSAGFIRQLATTHAGQEIDRYKVNCAFQAEQRAFGCFPRQPYAIESRSGDSRSRQQVTAQDEAVSAMADAVCIAKARMNDPGRPLATFLFLGPTGVGKTQCAKAVASYLFSDEKRLLRFDMNEYVDGRAVSRLHGDFRDPEGLLTAAIRRQPFSVVLFDEIEKAHPAIFDLLLQVLGEGRLTDALGRTADFGNAIIVMTSNLGAREAGAAFGLRPADRSNREVYTAAAEKFFRPEFINRIDRVVPFERLSREQIATIADRLIADVFQRDGLVHRRCVLHIEPAAMERVVDLGYHPELGARALKRCIERQLTQPVAAHLAMMAPDAPAVIRLYTGADGIAAHVQGLVHAERKPVVPATVDLDDWADVLDRVEDAIDRIVAEAEPRGPDGRLVQGELSSAHFRYLAIREYGDHLRRFVERIDRVANAKPPGRWTSHPATSQPRAGAKSLLYVGADTRAWRDLRAAQDFTAQLADLQSQEHSFGHSLRDQLTELVHELSLLEAMSRVTPDGDRCLLWLRSPAAGAGSATQRLCSMYRHLFPAKHGFVSSDVEQTPQTDADGQRSLLLEMPGIANVLAAERGTHFFTPRREIIVPVQVIVTPIGDRNARWMFCNPCGSGICGGAKTLRGARPVPMTIRFPCFRCFGFMMHRASRSIFAAV